MSILTVPDDKGKYWPSLGGQVCDFIEENLVFGPGDLRGEPAKLDDDKRALIWRMYEVYPQGHAAEGRRRFKRVGISLPKGCAKTELAAWLAIVELHPDGPVRCYGFDKKGNPLGGPVTDPYIPCVAYTAEQSDELCYGAIKAILEECPLGADFDVGLGRIMRKRGDGKIVSLSTAPNSRDGARTTFSVMDETHHWLLYRQIRAHQTMMANLAKRKAADPWNLEITTAPEPGAKSVAESAMEYARAVKEGRVKDARFFYYHRQASEEHKLDTVEDVREAVIEASGPAAVWRDIDAIVELWRDPTTDPAFFDRVYCNRLVQASMKAFDVELWKSLYQKKSPVKDGDMITLGFDGALFHDSTALVGTHVETGYQFVLGVWECPFKADNWQVPESEVDDAVAAAFQQYDVWRMYADPPYWQSWVAAWAGKYGTDKVIEWWTNRRKAMSYALEAYDTSMKAKEISHDGNEVMARHIGNAFRQDLKERDEEGKRLWLIRKERQDSVNKIDTAMAGVLSWAARMDAVKLGITGKSVYEERGPLVFSME